MAIDHELTGLATLQEKREQRTFVRLMRLRVLSGQFRTLRAYRDLFLDEDGELKPDAVQVIADLAGVARLGIADRAVMSDAELREYAGRRAIVLHMLARLDQSGVKMRDLARKMREAENE